VLKTRKEANNLTVLFLLKERSTASKTPAFQVNNSDSYDNLKLLSLEKKTWALLQTAIFSTTRAVSPFFHKKDFPQ
jgi:hypothetical protein